jgi:hypothetical protein
MLFSLAIAFNKIKVQKQKIYRIHEEKQKEMGIHEKNQKYKKRLEIKLRPLVILTNQDQLSLF